MSTMKLRVDALTVILLSIMQRTAENQRREIHSHSTKNQQLKRVPSTGRREKDKKTVKQISKKDTTKKKQKRKNTTDNLIAIDTGSCVHLITNKDWIVDFH